MKTSLKLLCFSAALLIACAAMTGCGGKKSDDNAGDAQTVSIDANADVDSQIDDCENVLESADSLPAVAKKSALQGLHDYLDRMSERGDLTPEQSRQISELLDKVNEKLKENADVDLDDPDLRLSDFVE